MVDDNDDDKDNMDMRNIKQRSSHLSTMKLLSLLAVTMVVAPSTVLSLATRPLRVTVFGGTGYVGSAVCERLVKRGHEVTAVSRRGKNPKPDSKELSKVCHHSLSLGACGYQGHVVDLYRLVLPRLMLHVSYQLNCIFFSRLTGFKAMPPR